MEEKILLNQTCYKTNLSEGIKAFVMFYILDFKFFAKFTKEELLDVIINELKVKENEEFESILVEVIETFDKKHKDYNFKIARKGIVEFLLLGEQLYGQSKEFINNIIAQNSNMVKKLHRINRKVLDYLDNQLFYKIIDCYYLIVADVFNSKSNPSNKKKIEISEKTYDVLYSDVECEKRCYDFIYDIRMWIFANSMEDLIEVLEKDKKVYIVINNKNNE